MKANRFSALTAICIGALMAAMWIFFLAAGQVPELQTRPMEIVLHLVAEFTTGVLLVVAGISGLQALHRRPTWCCSRRWGCCCTR